MRQRTDRGAFWRYWQDATEKGVRAEVHADHPLGGYYRHKHLGPVAIWADRYGPEGELLDPADLKCLIGINGQAKLVGHAEACELWTWIAGHYVLEDVYRRVYRDGIWPGEDHGIPNAPADTTEALFDQIDSAVSWIGLQGEVKDKEGADRIANARDRLNELASQAETLRKAEKKPFDDGAKAVQAKYKPYLDAASQAVAYCRSLLTPYLNKVASEAAKAVQEAAIAAGGESAAQSVQAPAVRVGGAGGRRTGLKTVTSFEIEDLDKVMSNAVVMNHPETIKGVKLAVAALVKAKMEIPGVKITKEKVAQ